MCISLILHTKFNTLQNITKQAILNRAIVNLYNKQNQTCLQMRHCCCSSVTHENVYGTKKKFQIGTYHFPITNKRDHRVFAVVFFFQSINFNSFRGCQPFFFKCGQVFFIVCSENKKEHINNTQYAVYITTGHF